MLIVSDANPIHFIEPEDTPFTELEVPNVLHACFFDSWKPTTEIRTRMFEETVKDYVMRFINADTNKKIGSDHPFNVSGIQNTNVSQPTNNTFDTTLDPWIVNTQISWGSANWLWSSNGGGCARSALNPISFPGDGDMSKNLMVEFATIGGRTYKFKLTGTFGQGADQRVRVYLRNNDDGYVIFAEQVLGGAFVIELQITPIENCNRLVVVASNEASTGSSFLELSEIELTGVSYGGIYDFAFTPSVIGLEGLPVRVNIVDVSDPDNEILVKKTDTLNFSGDINWTLIQYKGYDNFIGMPYDVNSPMFNFYLPSQFFRERNKVDAVLIRLSGGIKVNTGSSMDRDRRLLVDMVPDYKSNKLLIILQHAVNGVLQIDGLEWVIGEGAAYDYQAPPTEDYPLQGGEIYLTRKNYATKNVN